MTAIVCLGSYDLRVAVYTASLAAEFPDARLIVTGAQGNWTRGVFDASEAEVFGRILLDRGIEADRITLEPQATNIGENIAYTRNLIGDAPGDTIAFVTKPQTQGRVRATIPIHWPGILGLITAPPFTLDDYAHPGEGLRPLINEMVGDVERMIAYPGLGFQAPVEMPGPVLVAYEALKKAGYDQHCLQPPGRAGRPRTDP